jgi:hypothetical protein
MQRLASIKGPGWRVTMTEPLAGYDGILASKGERRLYEVKIRHCPFMGSYIEEGGYMISAAKLNKLRRLAGGDKFGVAADCHDGVFVATFRQIPTDARLEPGGRYDRNDPWDREWCYYIPARLFVRVCDTVNHARRSDGFL